MWDQNEEADSGFDDGDPDLGSKVGCAGDVVLGDELVPVEVLAVASEGGDGGWWAVSHAVKGARPSQECWWL